MAVFSPLNQRSWEAVFFDGEQFEITLESNRQLSLPTPMGSPVDPVRCKPSPSHKGQHPREVVKVLRSQFVTGQLRGWYETSLFQDNTRRHEGHTARHSWLVDRTSNSVGRQSDLWGIRGDSDLQSFPTTIEATT